MELRNKMGVSMMACKKALVEADGDIEKAIDILRKSGAAKADKKADRATGEGAVAISGRAAVSLRCETDFVARNDDFISALQDLADEANANGENAAKAKFESKKTELITQLGENISFGEEKVIPGGDTVGSYLHSNRKIAGIVALTGGSEELAKDIAMHVVANSPQVIAPEDISEELVAKEKEIWAEQLKNEGKPENIIEKIMMGKEKKFREEGALLKQSFVKDPEITIEALLKKSGAEVESFVRMEV
jgi:elongation factor Ts